MAAFGKCSLGEVRGMGYFLRQREANLSNYNTYCGTWRKQGFKHNHWPRIINGRSDIEMKTADLIAGPQLDALVALAQDWEWEFNSRGYCIIWIDGGIIGVNSVLYSPSTNRSQWAELVEVFNVQLLPLADDGKYTGEWEAAVITEIGLVSGYSPSTPGLALCKAVITAEWGDEIPDEIWEKVK